MQTASKRLRKILNVTFPAMKQILPESAADVPAPGKWSRKQELGHLVDSASNNHQRIVCAQLKESPAMPGYDGDAWVALHRYQEREWNEIVDLWYELNLHLAAVVDSISDAGWTRALSVNASAPMTVRFLFDDYIEHLIHHLGHMGVDTGAFDKQASFEA